MAKLHLGYAVPSGDPVEIPLRHTVVTGQTQEAGKTTTLEALVRHGNLRALVFVTKRGEGGFGTTTTVPPFFREQADWQFVASVLEASRGERLKFERAWIIRASKGAKTLADVQRNVRKALEKAKGLSADVYLTLDAYLDVVVPEIERVRWAGSLQLRSGLSVMDLTDLSVELQHLVIRSSITSVLNEELNTVVVIPEAWKFIPQGRNTPVKLAAESFIRQAAAMGNYLWLDSQDIGGIDKTILRSVPVWLLGVQRETNEIKRTLENIPDGIAKPKRADVATLNVGEFIACHGRTAVKTYVQPVWMHSDEAMLIAKGLQPPTYERATTVTSAEAKALQDENTQLRQRVEELERLLRASITPNGTSSNDKAAGRSRGQDTPSEAHDQGLSVRDAGSTPAVPTQRLLAVTEVQHALEVRVVVERIEVDGKSLRGRIARLIVEGFCAKAVTSAELQTELGRRGETPANIALGNEMKSLVEMGFFTRSNKWFTLVPDMQVNVIHAE